MCRVHDVFYSLPLPQSLCIDWVSLATVVTLGKLSYFIAREWFVHQRFDPLINNGTRLKVLFYAGCGRCDVNEKINIKFLYSFCPCCALYTMHLDLTN